MMALKDRMVEEVSGETTRPLGMSESARAPCCWHWMSNGVGRWAALLLFVGFSISDKRDARLSEMRESCKKLQTQRAFVFVFVPRLVRKTHEKNYKRVFVIVNLWTVRIGLRKRISWLIFQEQ